MCGEVYGAACCGCCDVLVNGLRVQFLPSTGSVGATRDERTEYVNVKHFTRFSYLVSLSNRKMQRTKRTLTSEELAAKTQCEDPQRRSLSWVDREKDNSVKSRLVLNDFNHDHGRTAEMFALTPAGSALPLKPMLAISSFDRNRHEDVTTLPLQLMCTQHML